MRTWQQSWDQLMSTYQPNRVQAMEALLDLVEAAVGEPAPRILDLGGGTGSLCLRALERWPEADLTLLDLDPVLMTIAGANLPAGVGLVRADLRDPAWTAALPHLDYDAVLAVMALHYLPSARLTDVYTEIAGLLRPGGLLVNVDHMPDPGLPKLSERIAQHTRRSTSRSRRGVPIWDDWWTQVGVDPVLGPSAIQRAALFADQPSAEWTPPASWHLQALHAGGYAEVGLGWRHGTHAAIVAVAVGDRWASGRRGSRRR
jgi:SAM-dependent methyltransferase